jgi:carboxypeptidase family protein/TonB-dependent receptor-like protein
MLRIRGAGLVLLFLGIFNTPCFSQTITGNIRGIVASQNGEPLSGASITIRSSALIGQTRTATSNELGVFRFPSLPIGSYSVEARLKGFDNASANPVDVNVGGTAYVPLVLQVTRTETVEVMADIPLIDLQNSGFSTVYKPEIIENVPTRRNMWTLIQVSPGVTSDYGDFSGEYSTIAFGSNRNSNSWLFEGLDITGPETGHSWWDTNPDIIQQIQVLGVGTPAEYGNHTGAVFNIVTKKGSNSLSGVFNSYFQTQALTDVNVRIPDNAYVFHRDEYHDITGQIGGPIQRDKIWFYGAVQTLRDSASPPGLAPIYAGLSKDNRYDFKITTRLGSNQELNGFFHFGKFDYGDNPSPYVEQSALGHEFGNNPAWGATLASSLNENLLMELGYAGWWSSDWYRSINGSLEDPFTDYTPPGGGPPLSSGGVLYPWDYRTYRHQINTKLTQYAENFLKAQHEFKFGVQYNYGSADTISGLGANGSYSYSYYGNLYMLYQVPFHYGGTQQGLGFFVDDTVTVNDRWTLNLGLRFDHNVGSFPDQDRLEVGTPSITPVGYFKNTGEVIPGIDDFIHWNLVSPRLGFTWQTRDDGRAALHGSFGVYYEHDVMGNWDNPPPGVSPLQRYLFDGEKFIPWNEFPRSVPEETDLRPPRALQYSIGYDHQTGADTTVGIQYVHKDTKDLIGWHITAEGWGTGTFTDESTGKEYTYVYPLPDWYPSATIQKGNDPGNFPGSEKLRYYQTYDALLVTFSRRFSDQWALNASYTWSRSYGLLPRMIGTQQNPTFYGNRQGSNPNNLIGAEGRLQGDRPHMFRAQLVFYKLPWNLQTAASVDFSSGRPYARQTRVPGPGNPFFFLEPPGTRRFPPVENIDLSIGKQIALGDQLRLKVDAEILNLLNSSQTLAFATYVVNPNETFQPVAWVAPRRLQLQLGLQF